MLERVLRLCLAPALIGLAGCAAQPASSVTDPAAAELTSERGLNAPYYTGADPDFPRGSTAARANKGS
ncbi:hypothetical protein [Paracraurococcus lichenis]|uniref:Septal ring lytic transglycosylase RlpA family lipoprotein n=1 Tax=Paracraurococcus lichenis TaxID=3064888 RepID=A0ABT9DUP2_9PROT|nr:hypothetical protein [Paracraurococcus sp. LOR1-02]MDO9707621.1 hypothetical protein [Paracraurococcus sp. LOR1-02]